MAMTKDELKSKDEELSADFAELSYEEISKVAGGDAHQYDPCPRCGCPNPQGHTHCVVCHTLIWGTQIC